MDIPLGDQYIINGVEGSANYQIAQSPELGRYLVASRDIKRGEIVLVDQPLATGPQKESTVLCPGCYEPSPLSSCPHCGWPICSLECSGAKNHEPECICLRSTYTTQKDWAKLSDCLMIVRCLLLKRHDPRKWKRLIEMETNWDRWSKSPLIGTARHIENLIRTEYQLSESEFPSLEIQTVQAILDINSYEVRLVSSNIQAAYKFASLTEHNCTPNTHKTISGDTLELTFRATTDIPQGAHISTSYCDILWPTWHRQQYLEWSKFFICTCERCLSSSELESHLGSFVCMDCSKKYSTIIPATPNLNETRSKEFAVTSYRCSKCSETFPAMECHLILKKAERELSDLDRDVDFENIYAFEHWLNKWTLVEWILSERCETNDDDRDENNSTTEQMGIPAQQMAKCRERLLLHPQNSFVLDVCHTLFLLYTKEGTSIVQLKRKECFGAHLLKATKPLFTGISKFRGTVSYELAMTKAAILVHQLEQTGVTHNLQHLAQEVLLLLHESQECLKYEPLDQPEGQLAQTGASQLDQFTLFFSELFPSLTN